MLGTNTSSTKKCMIVHIKNACTCDTQMYFEINSFTLKHSLKHYLSCSNSYIWFLLYWFRVWFSCPPQEPQSIVSPSWPSKFWIYTCCTSWWQRKEAWWKLSTRRSGGKSQRDLTCLPRSPVQLSLYAHSKSTCGTKQPAKIHFINCSIYKLTVYTKISSVSL